jgi:hypothetical protein
LASEHQSLSEVALAISAFKSDQAVIELLRSMFANGQPGFGSVIVVDSLGSGAIPKAAAERGWQLDYISADRNLGSAGNLDLRLRTAADNPRLRWCYAVNHDGEVDAVKVEALQRHGHSRSRVGAVYPQLIYDQAGGRIDAPRGRFSPYGNLQARENRRDDATTDVAWSSSNCALYNLDAIRDGVRVWPDLWMGWEDLALGWDMQRRGWVQLRCSDVSVVDSYEYVPVRILGKQRYLADKPCWYSYYQLRNLVLISLRSKGDAIRLWSVAARGMIDIALILLFRDRKLRRLGLLFRGIGDGFRQRAGKGPVP